MKGVGIFSGTFDPVHKGHVQFAQDALKKVGLEKVFFLVEPRPRRKQGVKAFEHRQAMVQLAIRDIAQLGSIVLGQDQFTPQDTLPLLKARFQGMELHLLMGDDMLRHLNDWPHVDELIESCHFVIGVRKPDQVASILERKDVIEKTRGLQFRYKIFESTFLDVSSSQVKRELRRTGVSAAVLPEVQDYIRSHKLYAPRSSS